MYKHKVFFLNIRYREKKGGGGGIRTLKKNIPWDGKLKTSGNRFFTSEETSQWDFKIK